MIKKESNSIKSFFINNKIFLLIIVAFIFSFALRLIWVQHFAQTEQFKFNNEFMINTNDGYFWAEGARDILNGSLENTNDLSPKNRAPSIFTAWVSKIVPLSFETIIFYMPAFFSSLIVIPIILIAKEFQKVEVGFIAALLASIAVSYYNRTMVGYFDTDFLNIVFPTVLLWSLISAIRTNEEKYFLISALDIIAYRWWYPVSYSLEFAFIALVFLYVVFQYLKKQDYKKNLILVSFLTFAMVNLDSFIRLIIVVVFFIALKIKKELMYKYANYIFIFAFLLFLLTGGFDPIWAQLKGYVFRSDTFSSIQGLGLNFYSVLQTVREAGNIPFETFANRISGHTITFIFSFIGYIWFCFKYPIMLLGLPMLGLGFLAYGIPGIISGGGLRFTIYAVPIMALGFGFLVYELANLITKQFKSNKKSLIIKYTLLTLFSSAALYPNILHINNYKIPTVFNNEEVKVLDHLKDIASREDYVVAWWDYGYPIRYYSDVKTLIDGGKHGGSVNFPVSFILVKPQEISAKMARLDVEYTEKRFKINELNKALKSDNENYKEWASSNIEQMILDYGFNSSNDFLTSLETNINLPESIRDIYLYLPNRMMNILPTVTLFSNIDLMSGEKKSRPFFYKSTIINNKNNIIQLGNGVKILREKSQVQIGQKTFPINKFVVTQYVNGKLQKQIQTMNNNSSINVIYMKNYKQFLILDSKMYNSTFIQLFVLENYDKSFYEPIILSPYSKVYKLKI